MKKQNEKEKITWRSFWNGPDGTSGPISTRWNIRGWPTIYVLDHKGVIRHKGHELTDEMVDGLLKEMEKTQ